MRFLLRARAEVGVVRNERAARRLHRRTRVRKVAARHTHDGRAFFGERHADCLTNAPARTRHDHHFVLEFHK